MKKISDFNSKRVGIAFDLSKEEALECIGGSPKARKVLGTKLDTVLTVSDGIGNNGALVGFKTSVPKELKNFIQSYLSTVYKGDFEGSSDYANEDSSFISILSDTSDVFLQRCFGIDFLVNKNTGAFSRYRSDIEDANVKNDTFKFIDSANSLSSSLGFTLNSIYIVMENSSSVTLDSISNCNSCYVGFRECVESNPLKAVYGYDNTPGEYLMVIVLSDNK